MNVTSSFTKRNVNRGKDYVKMAAISLSTAVLPRHFIVGYRKQIAGTKYKAKRDWDREAKAVARQAVDDYVEVANGRMSMEDFNEKYKGTGIRMYE